MLVISTHHLSILGALLCPSMMLLACLGFFFQV
jgi:hypothetical protein